MYRDSAEQVFRRIAAIRGRAMTLLAQDETAVASEDLAAAAELEAQSLAEGVELRLPECAAIFGLSRFAVDVLICLIAAEYDPCVRLLCRAMQRDPARPWLELGTVAELLDLAPSQMPLLARQFAPEGALRRAALVLVDDGGAVEMPASSVRVKVTRRLAEHLVGGDALPRSVSRFDPAPTPEPLADDGAVQAMRERAREAWAAHEGVALEIVGPKGCGKRLLARRVAGELGLPLVMLDLAAVPAADLERGLAEGRREAALARGLFCLAGWDAHRPAAAPRREEDPTPLPHPPLPPALAAFLSALDGPVFLTGLEPDALVAAAAPAALSVAVRFPTPAERAQLFARALAARGVAIAEVDLPGLMRRFTLDPARLEDAARAAQETARRHGAVLQEAELAEACRRQLRHDLASVADRVEARHRWEDLVVSGEVLDVLYEMIAYARFEGLVYDEWGFRERHSLPSGISALFAGPPGTGKTMCASVIANELGMELYRVDLSRVVSKWVGETEKNLNKIFDEAERSNAIVLFDEADSLFAKRSKVKSSNDRYANLEVNFLLQRIEAFSGVSILTSNAEDSIDSAFQRRLTFRVRFDKPDAEARALLWCKMFPPACRLAADVSPELLGELFDLSGGHIRNAALRAAFLAAAQDRPVDMAMCLRAAERECVELGRLVRSFEPIVSDDDFPDLPPRHREGEGRATSITSERRATRPISISHPRQRVSNRRA